LLSRGAAPPLFTADFSMNPKASDLHYDRYRSLSSLYSFMSASAIDQALIRQLNISDDERVQGIYFNDDCHFIVFTQQAFYWIRKDKEIICPYSNITRLSLPDNVEDVNDEREIEVVLKDGDFLFLPVINDTDDFLDIYCVKETIEHWISACANIEALTDLIAKLKAEIADYKLQPASWRQPLPVEYFETLIVYLHERLDQCLIGSPYLTISPYETLNINQPNTWRLMAEVLLAPKTFAVDKDDVGNQK